MSRNSEVVFTDLPQVNIPRSVFDIPQDIKTTFNVGELIPFYVNECIPGSSVKIRTNKVVRLQTLLTPLMDNLMLDTYYFFCPSRLLFNKWREFMGENTESAYLPEVQYTIPFVNIGSSAGAVETGDVLDYMGVPLRAVSDTYSTSITALPLRGYCMIWNEFFRDQNLQSPINVNYGTASVDWKDFPIKKPLPVNRYHDYFSSALIAPAKVETGFVTAWSSRARWLEGNPTEASFKAPVYSGSKHFTTFGDSPLFGKMAAQQQEVLGRISESGQANPASTVMFTTENSTSLAGFYPNNLYADLSLNQFGITIPNLRQAFQMEKFLERDASHGTRYQEQLLAHFGVKAQDSRLQRPEYLGGNRIPLNINQIINQASSSGEFLGDVGGMSLTSDSHFDVEYSCQEHGYLIGLMCVRYKSSYSQGLERFWFKSQKFDFAFPEFAHLTDQAVLSGEIYMPGNDSGYTNSVFGYQERYAEYKFKPDKVTGQMRPGISGSLAAWHLGDYYTDKVYLSSDWMKVDKSNVDRALTVTSAVADQLFADIVVQARWTLPLPVHSNPGFADHF